MKITYKIFLASTVLFFSSCEKFLERGPLTTESDETAWSTEDNFRLYANKYYADFFPGYGLAFSAPNGTPLLSNTNSDDVLALGNQANVTRAVPVSSIWGYTNVRSINIMIDRVQKAISAVLSDAARAHWLGIARLFRGLEYADLATTYGDVPYYDREILANELADIYKPRDPRNLVMDAVYDDLVYAFENVKLADGARTVNRYVVAGLITRVALHEATWQKYYYNNTDRARKFLELAIDAGNFVINSGNYSIVLDYKSLFTSKDLSSANRDVLLYRAYDASLGVTHSVASYSNLVETRAVGPTTDLLKSYICTDGQPYQNSALTDANKFDLTNLIKTRDSRLEATFYSKPEPLNRASMTYVTKFLPRDAEKGVKVDGLAPLPEFASSNNDTDYPVLRYAEVLINWIEAKAELASIGGPAVTQSDIDASVNKIRSRPLAPEATARGVVKTANLEINNLPNDPKRDPVVSSLIWEIRRERRMEFAFELSRMADLRRWSKIEYIDTDSNLDLLSGGWVSFSTDLPSELKAANVGLITVVGLNGTRTTYNGTNGTEMTGFFRHSTTNGRLPFLNQANLNPYLQPVGQNQINDYLTRGSELKQTEGWY